MPCHSNVIVCEFSACPATPHFPSFPRTDFSTPAHFLPMKISFGFLRRASVPLANPSLAQVNSGSDGHDGAFNPTQNVEIDMAAHPDGIYHYTSVNIPSGVTVTFKPNAANTPVVWLVQGNCSIGGSVSLVGKAVDGSTGSDGKTGGPGGFAGGSAPPSNGDPSPGVGPAEDKF